MISRCSLQGAEATTEAQAAGISTRIDLERVIKAHPCDDVVHRMESQSTSFKCNWPFHRLIVDSAIKKYAIVHLHEDHAAGESGMPCKWHLLSKASSDMNNVALMGAVEAADQARASGGSVQFTRLTLGHVSDSH